ncbi:hypothetical protein B1813_20325 [Saccharomonospora piscinae]|uniref:Knr4/Smi1-like domain-containing protein n=1 Tax=Saccharomonospora piscinae TaxID=687388 RepID=A0A1V8ZWW1_SACPI|nr:SMI1/KNR4 family protein [Saccharomonospora piscinae]OQO89300.1 hypothetical protein B1813_20325 [Saccharomonospora piscinae]
MEPVLPPWPDEPRLGPAEPADAVEAAVRTVLTAAEPDTHTVDAEVSHAALLLCCSGAPAAGDRLVRRWWRLTGGSVDRLVSDATTARAWAAVLSARSARGSVPDWADGLTPLDPATERVAQRRHLNTLRDGGGARAHLADLALHAWDLADAGDAEGARAALREWGERARQLPKPPVAALAGCDSVAALLVAEPGNALTMPQGWADGLADALVAALDARDAAREPSGREDASWPELVAAVLRLRGTADAAPPPASHTALDDAERRLGTALPGSYRRFLLTCDGLPADVVFPRLLGAAELTVRAGLVVISEPAVLTLRCPGGEVLEDDPVFGVTCHTGIHALLTEHRRLLDAAD